MSILNNTQEDAPKDQAIVITNADGNLYLGVGDPTIFHTDYLNCARFFCSREDAVMAMVHNAVFCKLHGLIYVQTVKLDEFSLDRIF